MNCISARADTFKYKVYAKVRCYTQQYNSNYHNVIMATVVTINDFIISFVSQNGLSVCSSIRSSWLSVKVINLFVSQTVCMSITILFLIFNVVSLNMVNMFIPLYLYTCMANFFVSQASNSSLFTEKKIQRKRLMHRTNSNIYLQAKVCHVAGVLKGSYRYTSWRPQPAERGVPSHQGPDQISLQLHWTH